MAQGARCDPPRDPRRQRRFPAGALQYLLVDRLGPVVIGKHPAAVAVARPEVAQAIENRCGKRHLPLLVALADDAQQQTGTVDACDLQGRGLADAQTAGIDQGKAGLVGGVLDVR